MFKWLQNLVRKSLLNILGLPETYLGADFGIHDYTSIVIIRQHRDGIFHVIADYQRKDWPYCDFLRDVSILAKKYGVRAENIVYDLPRF